MAKKESDDKHEMELKNPDNPKLDGQKMGDLEPKEVDGKKVREPKEEGNRDGSERDNTTVVIGGDQHEDARQATEKLKTIRALPMGGMTMIPPQNEAEAKKLGEEFDKAAKEADKKATSAAKTQTSESKDEGKK